MDTDCTSTSSSSDSDCETDCTSGSNSSLDCVEYIPVQFPPPGIFSSNDIKWHSSDTALFPYDRLADFRDGEGKKDKNNECSFSIRNSKYDDGDLLEYKVFWCSFGPLDEGECKLAIPPMKGTFPSSGIGSRPRGNKSSFNNHTKRGCQCRFIMKRYKDEQSVAVIVYSQRQHISKSGERVHGVKTSPLQTWGPKCVRATKLTHELRAHIQDMFRAGRSVRDVYDIHCTKQFERAGEGRGENSRSGRSLLGFDSRDNLVTKSDLYNLKRRIDKEDYMWDDNDQISIEKWISHYPKRVLYHREYVQGPPAQEFTLVLQSPAQRTALIELTHGSVLCMDSTFATNKYGFSFFTLVGFDMHQNGLPLAWSIQESERAEQIIPFLEAVKTQALLVKPDWMPSCFIIDCASVEVRALNKVFPRIPIYFCSWHVRRAWKENLIKRVPNREKLLEMNDDLGEIMYAESEEEMWSLWFLFQREHESEPRFLEYFGNTWMRRTAKWIRAVRTMPRANQNTNGSCEAWHLTLKRMIRRKIGDLNGMRLDRLVKELFGTVLPSIIYEGRCKQHGIVTNYKKEYVVLNSMFLARTTLRDNQVSFPHPGFPNQAEVESATTFGVEYTMRNIYSKFPSCNCKWADQGNMCKHQLKALLVKGNDGGTLVQGLGTRFGSQMAGIEHLDNSVPYTSNEDPTSQPDIVTEELNHDNTTNDHPVTDTEDVPISKGRWTVLLRLQKEMNHIVEGDDVLCEQAFCGVRKLFGKIQRLASSIKLSSRDPGSKTSAFVRPAGLTTKRRLGVVDLYHGAKRRGGVTYANKGKTPMPSESPQRIPDQIPTKSRLNRESIREELTRLGKNSKYNKKGATQRRSRGTAPTTEAPSRTIVQRGGREMVGVLQHLDVNVDITDESAHTLFSAQSITSTVIHL